jgi:hypothetical protein
MTTAATAEDSLSRGNTIQHSLGQPDRDSHA